MGDNETLVTEFILIGLSSHPRAQAVMFCLFLPIYLIALLGNSLMVVLIATDPHLHTPMYFFLSNLSFLDVTYTTSTVPQMLANTFARWPTISFARCMAQMYIILFLGIVECFLLAIMAYDRFAAVCSPLRYTQVMNWRVCIQLVAVSWASALVMTLTAVFMQPNRFCGHNIINNFTCELPAVVKLACADTQLNDILLFGSSVLTLLLPFSFILVTYVRIGLAVLRVRSSQGRGKAFSTCGSHLAVVSMFYGTAMAMYLRPQGKTSSDWDKVVSMFYGAVTPMINPLIYSLRNKDVKGALLRAMGRKHGHKDRVHSPGA
uniref:Olfactory receptor n=1 Tax=Sphenodon punctatus TaxID=8508 RepID=A0A8D0GJY2_SPHPU